MIHQGKVLKKICREKKKPVAELAVDLGLTRTYIYGLFAKQYITSEVIEQVCNLLKADPSIFFTPCKEKKIVTVIMVAGNYHVPDTGKMIIPVNTIISCQHFPAIDNKDVKR